MLCPAFSVTGRDSPLKLKPVPLALAAEIVSAEPPELVSVSDKLVLWPTCTLPNARLVGLAVSVPCVIPAPDSGMLRLGFDPLEVMVTFPLADPLAVGAYVTVNEVLWPAFKVTGSESPLMLKPVPLALAAEMVTLDPPEFVSVSDRFALLPTCTLPKARLVGAAVNPPCVTPVPDKGMASVGLDPLEVMVTLPLADPLAVGAYVTVNDVLWPAFNVTGSESPLMLKPVPLALAAVIVTLEPPELVKVPESDFEVPVCTLPKLKLVGLEASWPCASPLPESGTESVGLLAFELIVRDPAAAPAAVGVNVAVKVALWPAFNVTGRLGPVMLNPVPLAAAPEMVTLSPPVLLTLTGTLCALPSVTFPKFTLPGLAARVPAATPVPETEIPKGEFVASETIDSVPLAAPALVGAKLVLKVMLWFGATATGNVNPLIEKPVPLIVACEMLTVEPPVLVRVSDLLLLVPTWTLPKLKLEALGVRVPPATPSPASDSMTLLFCWLAVVAKVTLPLKLPPLGGANVTVAEVDAPACNVIGIDRLLIANPAPLKVA